MDLESLIAEIKPSLPEGTRIVDRTEPIDQDLRLLFMTEFSSDLMAPDMQAPWVQTEAALSSTHPIDDDDVRRMLGTMVERHNAEWTFIHGPEYAAGLARARAAA